MSLLANAVMWRSVAILRGASDFLRAKATKCQPSRESLMIRDSLLEDKERKQEQDESAVLIKQMAQQGADAQKQIAELLEQNRLLMERLLGKDK